MNKLLIIFIFVFYAYKANSQVCTNAGSDCNNGNGISTNPDNLLNPKCPELLNNFEWRLKNPNPNVMSIENYFSYSDSRQATPIINPFNFRLGVEYIHLSQNHNSNYQPADGWELLSYDFATLGNIGLGMNEIPARNPNKSLTRLPYMILYNKYSGTFRFFGAFQGHWIPQGVFHIELKIDKSIRSGQRQNFFFEDLVATNLFSAQGESVQALDQESDETQLSVFVNSTNSRNVFFWFDVPVVYDPCVCKNKSQLNILVSEVYFSTIPVNDSEEGVFVMVGENKKQFGRVLALGGTEKDWPNHDKFTVKPANALINYLNFKDLVLIAQNAHRYTELELSQFKNMTDFLNCDRDMKRIAERDLSFEQLPSILEAEKLLDQNQIFLSSTMSGCFQENAGVMSSAFHHVKGNYSESSNQLGYIFLALPGSNWENVVLADISYTSNFGKTIPAYPAYYERLGTFALLETPRLLLRRALQTNSVYAAQLRLLDTIRYSFNPVMRVNQNQTKIYVRIAYSGHNVTERQSGYHFDFNPDANYPLTSKFIPIEYFKSMPLVAEILENFDPDKLFIQFKVFFESDQIGSDGNPNESFLFYTYPVKLEEEIDHDFTTKQLMNELGTKVENRNIAYNQDTYFNRNEIIAVDGMVRIAGKLDVAPGVRVSIYATAGFELLPGAIPHPDVDLITGYPFKKIEMPQATSTQVNSFCSDTSRYKAFRFAPQKTEEKEKEENKANLYPNPNNGLFYLQFDARLTQETSLHILDASGKLVSERKLPLGVDKVTIEAQQLTKGLYFVRLTTENKTQTIKVAVMNDK